MKIFLLVAVFAVSLMMIGGGAEVQHAGKLGQIVASEPAPYRLTGDTWSILDLSAPQSGYAFAQTLDSTPPTFVSSELNSVTGVLTITFSKTIDATPKTNVDVAKIHIRESGSYAGGITLTTGELVTATDAGTISFNLTKPHREAVARLATPELTIELGAVRDTSGNLIAGTFDVSTAIFAHSFDVSEQDHTPIGMAFSNDGTKMFVVGHDGKDINEYNLSTSFNVTTASFANVTFSVLDQDRNPRGMAFSNDGAKMFVVGNDGKDINEYTLTNPFDLSDVSFTDVTFSVLEQDMKPEGMAFSNDGTKMFVVGHDGKDINEYTLANPFDLSDVSFTDVTFPVLDQDGDPTDIAFSNDGTKMFVLGTMKDHINEYTLTTPFNLSTASYDGDPERFSVSVEGAPTGMAFSNDGAKMFMVGFDRETIYEYTLSSVYPIRVTDGTLPTFVSSGLDLTTGVLRITFSETIDVTPAANVDAAKIHIRESGNYTGGGITLTASKFDTAADASTISFILTRQHLAAVAGLAAPELTIEPGAVQDTFGNLIAGTFDVSTATFAHSFDVSEQDKNPRGMAFSNDGHKMFVVGWNGQNIHEYTLPTSFNVSAVTYVDSFDISSYDSNPTGMAFSNDGSKMFIVDGGDVNDISEYTLSIPFNVASAAHAHSFNVTSQDTVPTGMAFSNDGAKMFVVDDGGNDISEYTLSIPFNVTSAAFADVTFPVSDQDIKPEGMAFSNDGAKMFVVGDVGNDINEYTLFPPFNVTSATFVHSFPVGRQELTPRGMAFSNDGAKMFVVGNQKMNINEYTLSPVYPIGVTENPPPTFVSSGLDLSAEVLRITFSKTIDATNVVAAKIHVRESGNYTGGGITLTAGELVTATDASTISFNLTEQHLMAVTKLDAPELTIDPGAVQDTFGNLIVGTFDLSTASYDGDTERFSVSGQETSPTGMAFSNDGAKMFVVGGDVGKAVNEYTLSTHFDVSTATSTNVTFSVSDQDENPTGMAFSNDGVKMFVVGWNDEKINEYTLSTPFDLSTASYDGDTERFSVSGHEGLPTGMAFSNDGTKMFVVGDDGNDISEYTLSTPFDVSTASYDDDERFSVLGQETSPTGMAFSNDGAKMFVVGWNEDNINEYTLLAPFDVSTATFANVTFSVSGQDQNPQGMAFSNDGAKMFVVGNIGEAVNEYTLRSVYPIRVTERPPPTFVSSELDLSTEVLRITFSETINVTNVVAAKIHIRESGNYTGGGITLTAGEIGTTTDASTISFNLTEQHLMAVAELDAPELTIEPGAVQGIFGNLIVGTFDVSTATYTGVTLDVSVRDRSPKDVAFSNNGTKMFLVGSLNEAIYEYTLSTPFKLSTATYNGDTEIFLLPNTFPTGMAFSNDGAKMFVAGDEADNIHEYDLDTPFDVSTASHVDSLHVYAQEEKPQGVAFSNDGAKMFVVGNDGQEINEYTLTTPFDLTAPPFANFTFSVSDQDTSPTDVAFSNDGTKMFVVGSVGDSIYEYTLSTPFDLTTATYDGIDEKFSVTTQAEVAQGMAFSNDGAKMFVVGSHKDDINEYTLSSVYPIGAPERTPPTFVSSELATETGVLTITFSETIDVAPKTNVDAAKIHIRESGSYAGGITLTTGELGTTTDASTISFTLTEQRRVAVTGLRVPELTIEPGAVRDTSGNLIVSTFDISTAILARSFPVSSQTEEPQGMAFSNDGAKMFIVGWDGKKIHAYNLTAPFDLFAATLAHSFHISTQDRFPLDMAFSNDGAKMFEVGSDGDAIHAYNLTAPFDLSTAAFANVTFPVLQDQTPTGMAFSNDGTKMFIVGFAKGFIHEYNLTAPFDISAVKHTRSLPVRSQDTQPQGMAFSNDGAKMFVVGDMEDAIHEYTLPTPFNVSAATHTYSFDVSGQDQTPTGMAFSNDGTKMFVVGDSEDKVHAYTLSSVYPIVSDAAVPARVTSDTPNGDYGPGTKIDVRLDFAEPVGLNIVPVADSQPVLQERFGGVATFQADGRHYAVLSAAPVYAVDPAAVEIVDITYPNFPRVVGSIKNSTDFPLLDPSGVDVALIGVSQYAIVGTKYGQFHTINVTDPENPSAEGMLVFETNDIITDNDNISDILAFQIGNYHYALVPATNADQTQQFFAMVNITDPGNPSRIGSVPYNSGPFAGFNAHLQGSSLVQIGGHHYAVVPGTSALVMLNVTDPANPTRTGVARSGQGGFGEFTFGASAVVEVGGHHYALIGSSGGGLNPNGLTIINITDPASMSYVSNVTRSESGSLHEVRSVTSAQVDGRHYALLGTYADITIIDITEPASPSTVVILDEAAPTLFKADLRLGRDTVTTGGRHYVPVTTIQTGWFSMLDITDPANPAFGRAGGLPTFDELDNPNDIDVIEIGGIHYALVAAIKDDGVQIINMSDPSYPVPVAGLTDGEGGFDVLGFSSSIAAAKIGEGYYALVAATEDNGIQIIDITDPANPSPKSAVTNATAGFGAMEDPAHIEVTKIGSAHYALVSDYSSVFHVINVTDPGSPAYVAGLTDDEDGLNLDTPEDFALANIDGTTYAMVIVLNDSILQMIDLSDPANPIAAGFASGDVDGFGIPFEDVASAEIGGRHYALTASAYSENIQIIDVTNPDILYPTATFTESLDAPQAVEVMESRGAHYALVVDLLDDGTGSLAVINVTDPTRPSLVANVTGGKDGFGAFSYPYFISVMESRGAVYALILASGDSMAVIDVTDPANPFNSLLPHLKLDLEGGRAVYAGQEDGGQSMMFQYLTTPDDHTVDLSYEGTGALHLGRGVLTYAGDGLLVSAELPEPGKPDSLSHERQIRVYGTDPKTHFVTTWEVASPRGSVTIPDGGTGGPYTVYWGDGEKDRSSSGDRSHAYTEAGNYTVAVSEGISKVRLGDDAANAAKLRSIVQWGTNGWDSMVAAFKGASQMMLAADDAPDLSGVASTEEMFRDSSINADLSDWGVSSVTDMSSMFRGATVFDGDVSGWDVSSVTDMYSMFQDATSFNGDVSGWDVSSVTDAPSMFQGATSFNGDLSGWDVSSATDMSSMFQKAASFNANLSGWDVSSAKDMSSMFDGAISFDRNLGIWYITMDGTSIDGTDVPGIVGTISAQNTFLDGQEPVYGIVASGTDSERFAVFDDDQLFMASLNGSQTEYVAKIMASGPQVFEDGNNWVDVRVSVPGGAPSTSLTVDAGALQSANEGDTVTLSGSAAGAPQNSLTYQWTQISPRDLQAVLVNVTAPVTTFVAPQVESDTIFTFILNATDGTDSASDLTRVTVLAVTTGPAPLTVHAESIVAAREGDSVTLSGSAAGAPQGSVTYRWVQTSPASPQASLGDAAAQTVTFNAPSVESNTTFTFTLNATDGSRSATDMARVTVLDAAADQGLLTVHAEANHAAYEGSRISLSGIAAGAPRDSVTYMWVQTSPVSPLVSLDDPTAPTVIFDAPSVESETVFTFTLNAAAGGRFATDFVTVTVLDVSDPAVPGTTVIVPGPAVPGTTVIVPGAGDVGTREPRNRSSAPMGIDDNMTIDGQRYGIGSRTDTIRPHDVTTGKTTDIEFTAYSTEKIIHFTMYLNLHKDDTRHSDSDTYISYDNGAVKTRDPHNFVSDALIIITEDDQQPNKKIIRVLVEFEGSMGMTDMILYVWNEDRSSVLVRTHDILNVTPGTAVTEPAPPDPEPGIAVAEPLEPDSGLPADPEPVTPDFADDAADPEPVPSDTLWPDDYDDAQVLHIIRMWSGFESESITDTQLLELLGLEDYQDVDLPDWMMTQLGVLVAKGDVTVGEFVLALQYMLTHA